VNSSNVTSHSQNLGGLQPSTLYHYRVYSTNASGGQTISSDFTLSTIPPPPAISTVGAGSTTLNSATIAWTTDQPATSRVTYGTTIAYGSTTTLNSNSVTAHAQSLGGLSAATLYHYRVYSTNNSSGEQTVSGDFTFMTATPPPVISGVAAGSITSSGATITWSTDQASTTQIQYGTTTSYGKATTLNSSLATKHSQALTALAAATRYHFRVLSTNSSGKQTVSGDFMFTTLPRR
jgi:fructose-1-phosphate kinase PfkB-like protein